MNFNPTLQNQATISSSSNHQQHQHQQQEEESLLQEPYQDHQSDQEKADVSGTSTFSAQSSHPIKTHQRV
ncbi:hypothetical protein Syun_012817 [Stephania yunnanensis]|uniref:Uncharacterized protein n=1 Tax=Stephania yunnanensis TaxID=152371 RepID=A0AAP0K2H2_9MAGN